MQKQKWFFSNLQRVIYTYFFAKLMHILFSDLIQVICFAMEKSESEYTIIGAQYLRMYIGDRNNFCLFYAIYLISILTFSLGIKVDELLGKKIYYFQCVMMGSVVFSLIMRAISENITKYNKTVMIGVAIALSSIISKEREATWVCTVAEPSYEIRTDVMLTTFVTSGVINILWYIPIVLTTVLKQGEVTLNCILIVSYFESAILWERFNKLYDLGYETVIKKH